LNEATGRIPPLNNGPPVGPGGNGTGGSYAGLGPPSFTGTTLLGGGNNTPGFGLNGIADIPHAALELGVGVFFYGTYISHVPSFDGFTYIIFGDRHWLDMMRFRGNASFAQQRTGPGPELGMGYYRDNKAVFPGDGNIYHYYGLMFDCCQTRGSSWMRRDVTYPATFGADGDIERSYFHDMIKESSTYYPLWLTFKNGTGTNYSTSIITPDTPGVGIGPGGLYVDTFQAAYVFDSAWLWHVWLHEPLAGTWMTKYQMFFEGVCGRQLPNTTVSYYCIDYSYNSNIIDGTGAGSTLAGGNLGPITNGTDAAEFGNLGNYTNILTGGQMSIANYMLQPGNTLKNMSVVGATGSGNLDQLDPTKWYNILGADRQHPVLPHLFCTMPADPCR
jgi:hypothetical protein